METKQTAVEWLIEIYSFNEFISDYNFDKAKQMEKEQIIEAAHHGVDFENSPYENAEQYYNKTYAN